MTVAIGVEDVADEGVKRLDRSVLRLPGLATAAVASIGAGVIHAGAIGIHAEHVTLGRLFIAIAVFQLAFGVAALLKPSRALAAIGAAGNLVAVAAWLTTRLAGISFIDGLQTRETAQFTDTACALLGVVAGGLALSALLVGWHRATSPNVALAAFAAAALAIPALFSGASHVHDHTLSAASATADDGSTTAHVHPTDPATGDVTATTAAAVTAAAAAGSVTLDAATAATLDESVPHTHNDDGSVTLDAATAATLDESVPHTHDDGATSPAGATPATDSTGATATPTTAAATAGAAVDPATGAAVDESQPHVHVAAAVPTVAYDPTKPIDLGGVAGVTPEEQARAENLVAINVVRLPQWSDPATAVAAGFHSIGDALTGFEHYINWDWINDDDVLDPDHPEALVYSPGPNGTKQLVSAMYMLPNTVALDQVPDIGGALTQWHIHDNLCFTLDPVAPQVAGITDGTGGCPPSLQKFPSSPMIHVWITPNKCGPFAALEGVGAGQIVPGQERLCDHVHGASGTLG